MALSKGFKRLVSIVAILGISAGGLIHANKHNWYGMLDATPEAPKQAVAAPIEKEEATPQEVAPKAPMGRKRVAEQEVPQPPQEEAQADTPTPTSTHKSISKLSKMGSLN